MSRKKAKPTPSASAPRPAANGASRTLQRALNRHGWRELFARAATAAAHLAGHPLTFTAAVVMVISWAASGPLFGYSDTWQLVINTSTTIVTFLMVFLIQNTQNRDTLAAQVKLAELIVAVKEAESRLATVEDLSEDELQALHDDYRRRADEALHCLQRRRGRP
jgi:low affinity Fe/Cu permease